MICSRILGSRPGAADQGPHGPGVFSADSVPSSTESQLSVATSLSSGCEIYPTLSREGQNSGD